MFPYKTLSTHSQHKTVLKIFMHISYLGIHKQPVMFPDISFHLGRSNKWLVCLHKIVECSHQRHRLFSFFYRNHANVIRQSTFHKLFVSGYIKPWRVHRPSHDKQIWINITLQYIGMYNPMIKLAQISTFYPHIMAIIVQYLLFQIFI